MKTLTYLTLLILPLLFASCSDDDDNGGNDSEYKQKMRDFVIKISQYAKSNKSHFYVIPQNGIELISTTGDDDGQVHADYSSAIDANGQEDLFYGYDDDDKATPAEDNEYLCKLLNISKSNGNVILVTDYCSTPSKMEDSYKQNSQNGYISFAAKDRELTKNVIPNPITINNENNAAINTLPQAKNFLYLINPEGINSKSEFIQLITATNYDLLIMDLFLKDSTFTSNEIALLRNKKNGGKRLVICYMSIGEAEDYRYYWNSSWENNKPDWLDEENSEWPSNYKVKYWDAGWQGIILGNKDAYLDKILEAGFDGIYLDIIEAFEYYE